MKFKTTFFAIFLFSSVLAQNTWKKDKKIFAIQFDTLIEQTMKMTRIPALGVAIIADGKPIFIKTYGYADVENEVKADNNTLFYIASATKSFTALAAAILDSQGLIKLDAPITNYLGNLTFKNNIPSEKITMRHFLTHSAGLSNDPLTFRLAYSGNIDERDLDKASTQGMTFNDTLLNRFNYDNLGYNI